MRLEIDQEACPAEDCLHSLDDDAVAWCIHECSDCDSALLVCWECSEAEESGGWMCEKCVDPGGFLHAALPAFMAIDEAPPAP